MTCTVEVEAHEDLRDLSLRVSAPGREQVLTLDAHAGQTSRHEVALAHRACRSLVARIADPP